MMLKKVLLIILIFMTASSAQAVLRPDLPEEEFSLGPNHLTPRTLQQRFDELAALVEKSQLYVPDPHSMSPAQLCYNMMKAVKASDVRRAIYKTCFYSLEPDRVSRAYKILIDEQLLELVGGPSFLRYNYILIHFVSALNEYFFAHTLLDPNSLALTYAEIFNQWSYKNPELSRLLKSENLDTIFLDAYLKFTIQLQAGRKFKKTESELELVLQADIREAWPREPEFHDLRKAKSVGDIIGFNALKNSQSCVLSLK